MKKVIAKKHHQLNVRVGDDVRQAIEDIRHAGGPVPSAGEVVRVSVLEYRDRLLKRGAYAPRGLGRLGGNDERARNG